MKLIVTHHATTKAWLIKSGLRPMLELFARVPEGFLMM